MALKTSITLLLIVTSVMKIQSENISIKRNNEKLFFNNISKDTEKLKTISNTSYIIHDKLVHDNHSGTKNSAWHHYLRTNDHAFHTDKSGKIEARTKPKDRFLKSTHFSGTSNPKESIIDPQFKCPEEQEIAPCICTVATKSLNCSAVDGFVKLKEILNTVEFPSKKFDKFSYFSHSSNNNEETILSNNTFGPLSFNNIFIGDSSLEEVESNAFSGSEDALSNFVSDNNNQISKFPFNVLNKFKNLTTVSIFKGSLKEISVITSTTMTHLNLNTNKISKIANNAFQNMPSLITLDLSYNNLVKMNGWSISSNAYIYVNHNNLTETTKFANSQPKILDQSYNFLTTFDQDVYEPILKKNYLVDVSSNNIDCSKMGWAINNPSYNPNLVSDCTEQ